jgi:hypothetical protein
MKKTSTRKPTKVEDYELRDEYDLSKMTIMPKGRFAPNRRVGKNVVVLAPELSQAFPSDEAVNAALRLVLQISKIPSATIGAKVQHQQRRAEAVS